MRLKNILNEFTIDRYGNKVWDNNIDFIKEHITEIFKKNGYKVFNVKPDVDGEEAISITIEKPFFITITISVIRNKLCLGFDYYDEMIEKMDKVLDHYRNILNIIKKNEIYIIDVLLDSRM